MRKDKIALQVYSVRGEMQKDFYGTLKKIKEFGYSGVEFAGLHGKDPVEVKKKMRRNRINSAFRTCTICGSDGGNG